MRAMLLCAGMGSRLGVLGDAKPKPLLPVCGIPILRFGIANLVAHGVRDLVINLHHNGDQIRQELGDGSEMGASIQYSEETSLLGTGGGLKKALALLDPNGKDEPFLSLNGKLIFDFNPTEVVRTFTEKYPAALGAMVVRPVADAMTWGAVDVDTTQATPTVRNILGAGQHMFAGVHVTRPSTIRSLPDGEACMVRQGYLPWLTNGATVGAIEVEPSVYFAEHSVPSRYLASNIDLLNGAPLCHPPSDLIGVHPQAMVDPRATIVNPVRIRAGARVDRGAIVGPHTVVGTDAHVCENVSISRSVAWDRTTVDADATDSILTPTGRMHVGEESPP